MARVMSWLRAAWRWLFPPKDCRACKGQGYVAYEVTNCPECLGTGIHIRVH